MKAIKSDIRTLIVTPEEEQAVSDVEIVKEIETGCVLVRFEGVEPIGMVMYKRRGLKSLDHVVEMQWLFVDPRYRGRGIAQNLIATLESYAKENGVESIEHHVVANNNNAIQLYERFGYVRFGTMPKTVKIQDEYFDGLYMVKFLSE